MSPQAENQSLQDIIEYIKASHSDVTLTDIMHLAQLMAKSLDGVFKNFDENLYSEFQAIAGAIDHMKSEMGALQANDLTSSRIPTAGAELDEVVKATETATDTIMGAAEVIMAADTSNHDDYVNVVNDNVMQIFEACSFQDITGQRISKVVETLQFIDTRISRLVEKLRLKDGEVELTDEEKERERRRVEEICHGPQMSGEGVDQNDIDALLNGSGDEPTTNQDDIDNLFN
jgi:chemotaxis protein CheZ